MSEAKEVIVAGCGASGMMAAIAAALSGARVTVLEGMERPGKKLLLTGNGRCNLTNLDPDLPVSYRSVEPEGAEISERILKRFSVEDTLDFFHDLGLYTANREQYVYPRTFQSAGVLALLLAKMRQLGVKLKYSQKITGIRREAEKGRWLVRTEGWTYDCDRLVLCCGSRAVPGTGSDGSGYELARSAGHSLTEVLPALTALKGKNRKFLAAAAGVRCQSIVRLFGGRPEDGGGNLLCQDQGELQIGEEGISGIVVFQVSRFGSLELGRGKPVYAQLDFLPECSENELKRWLKERRDYWKDRDVSVETVLTGILPGKLAAALLREGGIRPGIPMGKLEERQAETLCLLVKKFVLPVSGARGFEQCQVCAGGIPLREVDGGTLESKICPGLYFAGEMLDVDGPCGGYNLQWAWSSGYVAGSFAAK